MDERKRRIGENEAIFRAFNEQVVGLNRTFTVPAELMTVVCECGLRSCSVQFAIAPDEYARIREDSELFMIRPGHDMPEAETVVERHEEYWVVRKDPGGPAALARATDVSD